MEEFLSRLETAELLGISTVTLWSWEKQGILVPLRDIGGHVFYDPQDIKKLLLKKGQEGKRIRQGRASLRQVQGVQTQVQLEKHQDI